MASIVSRLILLFLLVITEQLQAADWSVPMAGNTFRTAPDPGGRGVRRDGMIEWGDPTSCYSVFLHSDRPAVLDLSILARVPQGSSTIIASFEDQEFRTSITGQDLMKHELGQIRVKRPGYARIDFQGEQRTGDVYVQIRDLIVSTDTAGVKLDYVRDNQGNMFYWGRRGPSVHLRYEVPGDVELQYAYSEITVPVGLDPIGSYFMANGFAEGYFGIQVNGPEERRVLFSVWSPFSTDNPKEIPEDQRIVPLGKGPQVSLGEFGNEGSGGQSFLVYPWKAGRTYRFLTEVKPDGQGHTIYTCWFGSEAEGSWRLIASFLRPKTNTHLKGFHCFLESFMPSHGYLERRAEYGNVWVRDVAGKWHECNTASFSVDATGGGRHRLDFAGGSEGDAFFLRNCGFFSETSRPGEIFRRESSRRKKPNIDFDKLPRG